MNTPLGLKTLYRHKRRYTKRQQLLYIAENKYQKTGKGVKIKDLIECRVVDHKNQAQRLMKYGVRIGVLFTLEKRRPQIYYAMSQRSEIAKKHIAKITPKEVTGVDNKGTLSMQESMAMQSLVDYVLPMMPRAPLYIHKLQMKTKLPDDCYAELFVGYNRANKAKKYAENIGNNHVQYLFYPNGTAVIAIQNSNNPLKLETEYDISNILTFFGQVRDRLILIVSDSHERLVPKVLEWDLTQCDINKDILVSDWLQFSGLKIQIKHLDQLFRVYVKSMGKDTVCRLEESITLKKPINAVEAINRIFNPNEATDELLKLQSQEITQIKKLLTQLTDQLASKK